MGTYRAMVYLDELPHEMNRSVLNEKIYYEDIEKEC